MLALENAYWESRSRTKMNSRKHSRMDFAASPLQAQSRQYIFTNVLLYDRLIFKFVWFAKLSVLSNFVWTKKFFHFSKHVLKKHDLAIRYQQAHFDMDDYSATSSYQLYSQDATSFSKPISTER